MKFEGEVGVCFDVLLKEELGLTGEAEQPSLPMTMTTTLFLDISSFAFELD